MKITQNTICGSVQGFRSDVVSSDHCESSGRSEVSPKEAVSRGSQTDFPQNEDTLPILAASSTQEHSNVVVSSEHNAATNSRGTVQDLAADGRGGTKGVDQARHPVQDRRAPGLFGRGDCGVDRQDHTGRVVQGASASLPPQGLSSPLLHGNFEHGAHGQRDHEQDGDEGDEGHHGQVPGGGPRLGGFRKTLQGDLPEHPRPVLGLRPVDRDDLAREWRGRGGPTFGASGKVAGGAECLSRISEDSRSGEQSGLSDKGPLEEGARQQGQLQHGHAHDEARDLSHGRQDGEAARDDGEHDGNDAPGDGRDAWRKAPQGSGTHRRRGQHDRRLLPQDPGAEPQEEVSGTENESSEGTSGARQCMSASQRLSAQLKGYQRKTLGVLQARQLEEQAWQIVPEIFQALTGHNRVCLMECACEPDSLLAASVQAQQKDPQAATRCSLYNGCDLSTDAGVRLVMRRIDNEKPQHVWISPPCGPFSPLQRTNQRSPAQIEELKTKRQEAIRIYVGATCVMHYAIQRGIHVTLELAERSDAWRLPVLHRIQTQYNLFKAVTKGCAVGLQDPKTQQPLQKGWRIAATHKRLAEALDLPCRCHKGQAHGKCEGVSAAASARYTKDYVRRAARVICQEMSHHETIRECQGSSYLVQGFGDGEFCTCGEVNIPGNPRTCPCCLQEKSDLLADKGEVEDSMFSGIGGDVDLELDVSSTDHEHPDMYSENFFAKENINNVESLAQEFTRQDKYGHQDCQQLLGKLQLPPQRQSHEKMVEEQPQYLVLGAYAYGSQYGVTKVTRMFPQLTRYLVNYLKHWSPEKVHCSSLMISLNTKTRMHRDVHNAPNTKNYVLGVSKYQHGEIWVEGIPESPRKTTMWKRLPNGKEIAGYKIPTCRQVAVFDARKWHEVQDWQGSRMIVGAYTSRGKDQQTSDDLVFLQGLGMDFHEDSALAQPEAYAVGSDNSHQRRVQSMKEEDIRKRLYLLHAATGHGSVRHMVDALKRRNADPLVIKLAQEFKCSVCQERSRVPAKQVATLEALPPKFHTISADIGHWFHAQSGEQQNFMVIVDEGSRYRVAKILSKGSKKTPNAATCINYMSEGWIQMFGKPKALRLDPAGSFRSTSLEGFCDRNDIFLDLIPGEAHWQIGIAEQAIQGLKVLMTKMCEQEPDLSPEEALSEAVATFNRRDMIRGFSPMQHVLGQSPDETGHFVPGVNPLGNEPILNKPLHEFQKEAERRAVAEKGLADWQAQQRVKRALNSRNRPQCNYLPGDLVYFWRTQEAGKSNKHPGTNHGRFLGPARILAMESRQGDNGETRPGNAIWVVRGRRLLKCSREQLRPASSREEALESLTPEGQAPWTFSRVAQQIGGSQYEDISQEIPSEREWQRAQDILQEVPPVTSRVRGKRPAQELWRDAMEDSDEDEDIRGAGDSQPSQIRRRRQDRSAQEPAEQATAWWNEVEPSVWDSENAAFWVDHEAAEIGIDLPETNAGMNRMTHNLPNYFVGALRRKAVEVSERRLSPEDKEKFRGAKAAEVRNFVAAKAFEALPPHLRPSPEQAISMRWILTWKQLDNGGVKPKARAVLLGYQDPQYEYRSTTAPVMTRLTRQLFLQASANLKWKIAKGDVSGAFLQGRDYPNDLYCVPCDEILAEMGLPPGTVTRLKKACYGLVEAPLEWYRTVAEYLESLGFRRLWADSCCWTWHHKGQLRGMVTAHVDDFMFGGLAHDKEWQAKVEQIRNRFGWGSWEEDKFTQCGVLIETVPEGFALSQPNYLGDLKEISLSTSRRKERTSDTTPWEKGQLRTLLGGLSWYAQQTGPHIAAEVSMMLSEVNVSTVETIVRANLLLHHAKGRKDHRIMIHRCEQHDMQFYAWVDAASQNRVGGGSTQGILVGAAPSALLQGEVCNVSMVSWQSAKIDRTCRSPGAAESQAAVNGEDALFYARYQWHEILNGHVDVRHPERSVKKVGGTLITDSRNVYDKLNTEVLVVKGAEKRTNLELLSLKEAQQSTNLIIRWVHSEAQLANSLTKGGSKEIELFYSMNAAWRIVEDPDMQSARKRKSEGMAPLEQRPLAKVVMFEFSESQGSKNQRGTGACC